jgi:hypothetical protein
MALQQDQFVGNFEAELLEKIVKNNSDTQDDGVKRTFATGATRDTAEDKYDPEGFLSPIAIDAYCEYMHRNRYMADGSIRDSDNWQNGMPFNVFMKSLWRHAKDAWTIHRGYRVFRNEKGKRVEVTMLDALCGLLFNTFGYLHEYLLTIDDQPTELIERREGQSYRPCGVNNLDQKM